MDSLLKSQDKYHDREVTEMIKYLRYPIPLMTNDDRIKKALKDLEKQVTKFGNLLVRLWAATF
jgi:hypothetical protein